MRPRVALMGDMARSYAAALTMQKQQQQHQEAGQSSPMLWGFLAVPAVTEPAPSLPRCLGAPQAVDVLEGEAVAIDAHQRDQIPGAALTAPLLAQQHIFRPPGVDEGFKKRAATGATLLTPPRRCRSVIGSTMSLGPSQG